MISRNFIAICTCNCRTISYMTKNRYFGCKLYMRKTSSLAVHRTFAASGCLISSPVWEIRPQLGVAAVPAAEAQLPRSDQPSGPAVPGSGGRLPFGNPFSAENSSSTKSRLSCIPIIEIRKIRNSKWKVFLTSDICSNMYI